MAILSVKNYSKLIHFQLEDESSMKKILNAAEQLRNFPDEPEPCGNDHLLILMMDVDFSNDFKFKRVCMIQL